MEKGGKRLYKILATPADIAEAVASEIAAGIREAASKKTSFSIALSGGNTPKLLFRTLAEKYSASTDWNTVHIFWGDERCVPPGHSESNYGMTRDILLEKINVPAGNVHRIRGEAIPGIEAQRYADEILKFTRHRNGCPVFDMVILGMGDDGHTASIFPGNSGLFETDKITDVAIHPVSGQVRITVTGKVINNAGLILFMVTGIGKAGVIRAIFKKESAAVNYPAALVEPASGKILWFLDKEAGKYLT